MKNLVTLREGEAYYQQKNVLKIYNDKYKLFVFKHSKELLQGGLVINDNLTKKRIKGIGHNNLTEKERQHRIMENRARSMRRSKTKIADMIEMNDFKLFGTFTFSPKKVDRYNDEEVVHKITTWLSNQKRVSKFEHLIIPERHQDGALHFHGLLTDVPQDWLVVSDNKKDKQGRTIYNLKPYTLGYSNFSYIENISATAKYCAKYIQKDLNVMGAGKRRYWHSKGLKMPRMRENVDIAPYILHEDAKAWNHKHYTGFVVPKTPELTTDPTSS